MKHLFLKVRQNLHIILLFTVMAVFYLTLGCPIRLLTGVSCPGCGMSRAVFALLQLDLALAFEMHPLVFLLPVAVIIYLLRKRIPQKAMTALCVFALLLLTAVYLARMTQHGNVVYADFESGLIYKLFNNVF